MMKIQTSKCINGKNFLSMLPVGTAEYANHYPTSHIYCTGIQLSTNYINPNIKSTGKGTFTLRRGRGKPEKLLYLSKKWLDTLVVNIHCFWQKSDPHPPTVVMNLLDWNLPTSTSYATSTCLLIYAKQGKCSFFAVTQLLHRQFDFQEATSWFIDFQSSSMGWRQTKCLLWLKNASQSQKNCQR